MGQVEPWRWMTMGDIVQAVNAGICTACPHGVGAEERVRVLVVVEERLVGVAVIFGDRYFFNARLHQRENDIVLCLRLGARNYLALHGQATPDLRRWCLAAVVCARTERSFAL